MSIRLCSVLYVKNVFKVHHNLCKNKYKKYRNNDLVKNNYSKVQDKLK